MKLGVRRFMRSWGFALVFILCTGCGAPVQDNITDPRMSDPLCYEDQLSYAEAKRLLENGSDPNCMLATHSVFLHSVDDPAIAQLAIDYGADVNLDGGGAAEWNGTPLHMQRHLGVIKVLIANGADVNHLNWAGMTPLDSALYKKDKAKAKLLRKHGGKRASELKRRRGR